MYIVFSFVFLFYSVFDSMCTNEQEIIDILYILPVNKAIGADLISHKMLKATKFSIVKPFLLYAQTDIKLSNKNIYKRYHRVIQNIDKHNLGLKFKIFYSPYYYSLYKKI